MRSPDAIRLILRSLYFASLRSSLTALGIAVGICAVTLLTALGEGVRDYVLTNFSQFGTRIIAINPGKTMTSGMGGLLQTDRPLTLYDAEALTHLPHVTHVVPLVQGSGTVEARGRSRSTDIIGANHAIHDAWQFNLALGRGLPQDEAGRSRNFAVLGHKLQQELFLGQNPLGQIIRVGGMRFRVVGVMAAKGQMLGFDLDDMVFIPIDKALMLFNRDGLMEIDVVFSDSASTDTVRNSVRQLLSSRHGSEDFNLISQDDMLQSLDNILRVLTGAVAALGAISLLVGAVGIVTIMTTAVRERTSEIGLLSALGCNQRQVLLLFLGEAVALSLAGGITGIVVAILLVVSLQQLLPALPLQLSLFYLGLSLLLSIAIGLAAGITPARHAAQMNPIDALRAE
jgi:putative ABC transport system permease protein